MVRIELERKRRDNRVNICGISVPFNNISSDEERNFTFQKKLTKKPTIQYLIVPETHRVWDELNPTDIWR